LLDRNQIKTTGIEAVGNFLTKLQVFKASADLENARQLYCNFTAVESSWNWLRDLVLNKRQPRKVFVQANTFLNGDCVELREYEPTPEGLIQSFVERAV
jgi:dipeptidyl-peptidase-3